MAQHRHIVVRGLGDASDKFEPYGGGKTRRPRRVDNRPEHAGRLRGDLANLTEEVRNARVEQASVSIPIMKRGVTVAVSSRPGEQLAVGTSLRANSRGMQLLNVQRSTDGAGRNGRDQAVLFLTEKAIGSLGRSLSKYEEWVDYQTDDDPNEFDELLDDDGQSDGRRPRNFWLFESASSFRIAKVEDLWTDALESFPRERGAVEWEIWVRAPLYLAFEAAVDQLEIQLAGKRSASPMVARRLMI